MEDVEMLNGYFARGGLKTLTAGRLPADTQWKADEGKSNPLLLEQDMPNALSVINRVLDYGLLKYERKSWLRIATERWDAACGRHRRDRYRGQDFDTESGLLHMAHEAVGLIIQIELYMRANPQCEFHKFNPPPQEHKVVAQRQPKDPEGHLL